MPEDEHAAEKKGASNIRGIRGKLIENKKKLVVLALVLILGYAFVYQLVFTEGPSYFGDDTVYTFYAWRALHGVFGENGDVFTLRLLNIYPIAFSYLIFGMGGSSSAGWAVFTLLGSIFVTFLIGKELYNEYVGLIAALLLSFFPLMTVLAGTPTPNVPEEFMVGLAFLCLLYGMRRNSKGWYFASGASLVAAFLTTPESSYAFPFIFIYILFEIARKRVKIDKTSGFFVVGLFAAGAVLLLANYALSGNPLITISGTAAVYSTAGTPAAGVLINGDLSFYFKAMFPYNILSTLGNSLANGRYDPIAIWSYIYGISYNYVGFFFYAMVLCAAYLIVARERRAFAPLLWLIMGFLLLEFGPIYISLVPFRYILTHRLERYLTLIAIPLALILSMAMVNFYERMEKAKHRIIALAPILLVVFLIATAIPVEQLWHTIVRYQTYDQATIAGYLSAMPNTTRIAYESGFSVMLVYMHYSNLSRFLTYDQIANCTSIPAGDYVVIPKYISAFGLDYTPDPSAYCPNWKLILYPQINGSYPSYITGTAQATGAKLYYVPT